jgi:NADH:ubiquinone reductase (H+-translocating)
MHYDIVIIGGGAGGLELAARLGRSLGRKHGIEKVLLVDRSIFHIWKPSLHEVAAGTLDPQQEGLSYPILARRNHFGFSIGELSALDATQKTLTLAEMQDTDGSVLIPERRISFKWCVLAVGSGSNTFGTPGVAEHCFVLEQVSDAEHFRRHLLAAFTRAAFATPRRLGIAIVGGGATGVELSAELLEAHQSVLQGYGPAQQFALDITLVEAGPRILGALPEKISAQAHEALVERGVKVLTATQVLSITDSTLHTAKGDARSDIHAELLMWAAGIKAADRNAGYGLATNRFNQFVVNDQLQTSVASVYALGDCAACTWVDAQAPVATSHAPGLAASQPPRLVPARAQAANQQATHLHAKLLALLNGKPHAVAFVYRDFGSLVSLGNHKGVGSLMGSLSGRNFFVEGLLAKGMYMSLHLMHHRAILGVGGTVTLALARLLQRRVSGRLKLH